MADGIIGDRRLISACGVSHRPYVNVTRALNDDGIARRSGNRIGLSARKICNLDDAYVNSCWPEIECKVGNRTKLNVGQAAGNHLIEGKRAQQPCRVVGISSEDSQV